MNDIKVEKYLRENKMFNDRQKKQNWVKELRKNMRWSEQHFKQISPRLFKLLSHDSDKVKIPN